MNKTKYNRLAAVMAEENIKNKQLAKYLHVSIETISNWRQNKTQPSLMRIYEMAEYFKIDICNLLVKREWENGPSQASLAKIEEQKEKDGRNKAKKKNQ